MTTLSNAEPEIRHERIDVNGITLHVAMAGEGPPVILLHGFPENWRSWRHQITPLAQAGYSVWAPDMRGYNLSDRPAEREAYALPHLIADVAGLVRATGSARAHIGGHDWGGVIAWTFAATYPQLTDHLLIFNAPHLRLYLRGVRRPRQMIKSWYVLMFLIPGLAEAVLSSGGFHALRTMFARGPAVAGAFDAEDVDAYVQAMSAPGALTAALNYYRANAGVSGSDPASYGSVEAPTLVLWGEQDPALSVTLLDGIEGVAPRVQVRRFPGAGHWIQNEIPDVVNAEILAFLTG